MKPSTNCVSVDSEAFAQFNKATSNTANCFDAIASSIPHLLLSGGPSHISRFVAEAVFDSIKGQPAWPFTHIGKKIFKSLPAVRDRNTTSAIILKIAAFWVRASLNHPRPNLVRVGSFISFRVAMSYLSTNTPISQQTTTRASGVLNQIAVSDNFYHAAITAAKAPSDGNPIWLNMARRLVNYFKLSKTFSDQIKFCRHNVAFSMLCSVVGVRRQPALTAILANRAGLSTF